MNSGQAIRERLSARHAAAVAGDDEDVLLVEAVFGLKDDVFGVGRDVRVDMRLMTG